ncbi:hypothetical protein TeGR_g14652, partial [Tetraparma gracilis]
MSSYTPPKARVNGFSAPLSREQLVICSGEAVTLALFLVTQLVVHPPSSTFLVTHIYLPLTLVRVLLWLNVSTADPSVAPSGRLPCFRSRPEVSRFCSTCKKMIPDLDHHCTWLNTCVGSANYGRFLSLASLCASAHGLGAAASVLAALEGGGGG